MAYFEFMFSYWWLILPAIVLSLWAQAKVSSAYSKYRKLPSVANISGYEAARKILSAFNVDNVNIEITGGMLSDHYDPLSKTLRLSKNNYYDTSVAAIGIAAHECGHAIQHANGYIPLILRNTVYPVAALGTNAGPILILVGMLLGFMKPLIGLGILLFAFATVFSILTLPVEFDASSRAVRILGESGMLTAGELTGAKKVLSAAALTYVAAALASVLTLIRLILISNRD